MKRFTALVAVATLLLQGEAHIGADTPLAVRLTADVWCEVGTDGPNGHADDFIYFLTTGRGPSDNVVTGRAPAGTRKIECHNQGSGRLQRDFVFWEGSLTPGQSVELTVVLMEDDPGDAPGELVNALQRAGQETSKTDSTIGTIIQLGAQIVRLFGGNQDDLIGAFAVRAENSNGLLKVTWQARDSAFPQRVGNNTELFLRGSGADMHVVPHPGRLAGQTVTSRLHASHGN